MMVHKFDPRKRKKLLSALRAKRLPAKKTLKRSGLQKGMVMADIGAGNGYFSLPAAEIVGSSGLVMAFDISETMLQDLKERAEQEKLLNIQVSLSTENSIPASSAVADMAFLCNVLHETADPLLFLGEVKRVLKKNGRIVVIEWEKLQTQFGPPFARRIDKKDTARAIRDNGFKYVRTRSIGVEFYAVTARKP